MTPAMPWPISFANGSNASRLSSGLYHSDACPSGCIVSVRTICMPLPTLTSPAGSRKRLGYVSIG